MQKSYPTIFITTAKGYTSPLALGYSQLTLAQIKQLAQQELPKYGQQIGLASSIRFEAAEPLMKLSDLLNEFLSFKQKTGLAIAVYTVSSLLANI